jgi:hypothetical protein
MHPYFHNCNYQMLVVKVFKIKKKYVSIDNTLTEESVREKLAELEKQKLERASKQKKSKASKVTSRLATTDNQPLIDKKKCFKCRVEYDNIAINWRACESCCNWSCHKCLAKRFQIDLTLEYFCSCKCKKSHLMRC